MSGGDSGLPAEHPNQFGSDTFVERVPARFPLPYASNFRLVGGYRMHYIDEGEGPVIVMVHGNPTWSYLYRDLVAALKNKYRVIVPDHIGCGFSERTPGVHLRASDRVGHLEELLEQLGVDRFSLVMHDWGGSIGTSLAVRHHQQVDGLLYFNTTLGEIDELPRIIRLAASPFVGEILTKYTPTFVNLTTGIGVYHALPQEVRQGYLAPYRTPAARQAIWDFVSDIPFFAAHPSYDEKLGLEDGLRCLQDKPVRVLWGMQDPCFHPGFLRTMRVHFPSAVIEEFPKASHLVMEDEPIRVRELVETFFSGVYNDSGAIAGANTSGLVAKQIKSTLYEAVAETVANSPARLAVIEAKPAGTRDYLCSYRLLWSYVQRYRRGLKGRGMLTGDRVLILVQPGRDFLASVLAVLGNGGVPVFVDPGVGRERLRHCIEDAQVSGAILSPAALALRVLAWRGFRHCKYQMVVTDELPIPGSTGVFAASFSGDPLPPEPRGELEFIAYTSGGTGVPKGVCFSAATLREQLGVLREVFGFQAGQVDLPLLPVFSLFTAALGSTSVFPVVDPTRPLSLDPEHVVGVINEYQVTSSFGSPTLWAKIAGWMTDSSVVAPSLERVLIAGAPVSDAVLKSVSGALPSSCQVYVPYGATEALPVSVITAAERHGTVGAVPAVSGEQGLLVGRPISGIRVMVARRAGNDGSVRGLTPCATGEIGDIWVAGPTVSVGYHHHVGEAQNKFHDGAVLWHRMGDVGYFDSEGHLYFCGRAAHVVSTPSGAKYPIPLERIFNQHPRVARSALIPFRDGAAMVIEPLQGCFPRTAKERGLFTSELQSCIASVPEASEIKAILFHPSFPVDGRHNAKIFRDQLAEWAKNR